MNIALICIISVLELGLAKFCNGLIVSFGLGLLIYISLLLLFELLSILLFKLFNSLLLFGLLIIFLFAVLLESGNNVEYFSSLLRFAAAIIS